MEVEVKLPPMWNGVKEHVKRNKKAYLIGSYVLVAGVTYLVARGITAQQIGTVNVRTLSLFSNRATSNITTVIESGRQGPPSWVVRCLETDRVYTSQRTAALVHDITETHLSKHLNGLLENAGGFHFERICMAA